MSAIRAFVAVAQTGGFSTGARAVGLTRSAAGKALVRLEERLGTRLLHRTTRNVSLTTEGQIFLDRCIQILADLEEAEAAIRQDAAEPTGVLRLTIPDALGRRHIMPIVCRFLERCPAVRAEINITDRILDIIDEGYDLAVRCGGPATDNSLIAKVVARSRMILCASPDYIAAAGEPLTIEDVARHSRVTLGDAHTARPWRLQPPRGAMTQIGGIGRLHLNNGAAVRYAVREGLGLGHLPESLIAADLAFGRLVPLLTDHKADELTLRALYPHRRHLPAKVRSLVDLLAAELEGVKTIAR